MNNNKWTMDPLGRSAALWRAHLVALCTAIVITGSAWPIYAGSVRPIVDTPRGPASGRVKGAPVGLRREPHATVARPAMAHAAST